ncbi:MAG: AAA family ATPase [Candidatus Thiodiazotropha lotti]|nr:AAA family ATPase [Candidatus Thiodiazotropha lotti]MCW4194430.1 AAA family ATPase [Candidatus Thiodiazotropha lotti]
MYDQKNYSVLFSRRKVEPKPDQVVIFPSRSEWNDFGFHIWCEFIVWSDRGSQEGALALDGEILIGFLPPAESSSTERKEFFDNRTSLISFFEKSDSETYEPEDLPPFYSMIPNMEGYRIVVDHFGTEEAGYFLKSVNDLVVYKEGKDEWINKAFETEVFNRGFMRNSEQFFAFHNADSVLEGLEAERFDDISSSLDLSFSLDHFENDHNLNFRFSSEGLVPRRINILIGKNGIGKSLALNRFCRAALQYVDKDVKLVDAGNSEGRPLISRLLAVATPGETTNTFPSERKKSQKLFYRRLNLTRGSRSKRTRSIPDALVQLARKDESIGRNSRWSLFIKALEKSLPLDSVVLAEKSGEFTSLKSIGPTGGEQDNLDRWSRLDPKSEPRIKVSGQIHPLSSGQLTFLKFVLLCCLYIENGSFVLMDEPETHLHPNMISDFVDVLDYLLENTGSQAILATHSAYFVREIPSEQVHVLREIEPGFVSIDHPRLKTFGATIDSISQFVFGDDVETKLADKVFNHMKGKRFEDFDEQLSDEVSLVALMGLRRRLESENEET